MTGTNRATLLPMNRWEALAILMTLGFLNYLDRNLIFPMLNLVGRDLRLDETQLGALATGFHVVYACSAPLLGYVSDRLERRTILLVTVISWSAVTALSGTATGFLSLLLWRSLTGLGEGGYFPTAISLIGDLFEKHERGRVIAFHGVCTTLGGSAGYALGGAMGQRLGWRWPFLLAVIPGLLLALVVWRRFREPPRGTMHDQVAADQRQARPAATRTTYLATVCSAPVLLISFAACAAAFAMNALNTFFPKYLEDVRQFSVASAGILSGLFFSVTLVGQLGGGFLSDRLATRTIGLRPLLVFVAYATSMLAALTILAARPVIVALAAYGVTQLGRGFAEPNLYGTIIDAVPAESRGSAQGFLLMLTFGGAAASPLVTGYLIKTSGYGAVFTLIAVTAGLSAVLAAGLGLRLRRAAREARPG